MGKLLLAVVSLIASGSLSLCHAQRAAHADRHEPVTVAVWGELGFGSAGGLPDSSGVLTTGAIGAYGELSRYRFRPALEVRQRAGAIFGTLAGPRIGYKLGPAILFGGALFGPNYYNGAGTAPTYDSQQVHGIAAEGSVGMEFMPPQHPNYGVRIELEGGNFSAPPGTATSAVSVGFILCVP